MFLPLPIALNFFQNSPKEDFTVGFWYKDAYRKKYGELTFDLAEELAKGMGVRLVTSDEARSYLQSLYEDFNRGSAISSPGRQQLLDAFQKSQSAYSAIVIKVIFPNINFFCKRFLLFPRVCILAFSGGGGGTGGTVSSTGSIM